METMNDELSPDFFGNEPFTSLAEEKMLELSTRNYNFAH